MPKSKKKENDTKIKEFTVEFVQLIETINDTTQILTLNKVFEDLSKETEKRTIPYNGEKIRLELIKKINSKTLFGNLQNIETLWELNFIRIKDVLVQGLIEDNIYHENGLETFLGNNKKLTESLSLLYDSANSIFIIEKNINLPLSAILAFFINILGKPNLDFSLINDETKLSKLKSSKMITSFELSLSNINDPLFKTKFLDKNGIGAALTNAIRSLSQFNSNKLRISLSVNGNSKKNGLTSNDIISSAEFLANDPHYVNRFVVNAKEKPDSAVEKINLFENRLKDVQKITYLKTEAKKHADVAFCLLSAYNKKKLYINKIIKVK